MSNNHNVSIDFIQCRKPLSFSPITTLIAGATIVLCLGCTSCATPDDTNNSSDTDQPREPARTSDIDEDPVTRGLEDTDETRNAPETSTTSDTASTGETRANDETKSGADSTEPHARDLWIPPEGDFVLKDTKTGSLWNLRGEAFKGPMKGAKLEKIPSFNSFWFAWSVFYHGSEIWNRDRKNQTEPIRQPEQNCLVPCNEIQANLPKDQIPAMSHDDHGPLPNSKLVPADSEHAQYLDDSDFVFGVVVNGEPRAYAHNIFWWHEIYNDKVGDTEFAVTFCPLTGSGIVFKGKHAGKARDFGVSGKLYNSNLVMFDRESGTEWAQMLGQGVNGPLTQDKLERLPVVETTWERWRQMHPDTLVTPNNNSSRNYNQYPYGDYRTNHSNTFKPTNPAPDDMYPNKARVLGLVGDDKAKAYAFPELAEAGDRVVVNDTFEQTPLVVVFEKQHRMAIPFSRKVDGQTLEFEGVKAP